MPIRSLTLATLLLVAAPVFAADSDAPLAQERGKARPLVIIAPSQSDQTLVSLKKALEEPANRKAFTERNMVLYTVVNTLGQRDGKNLDAQTSMALIRELKLGAGGKTRVILIGKDGEKKLETESIQVQEIFATIDQMPMREKEASAPAAAPASSTAPPPEKAPKAGKGGAPTLDD
ncbi:DUF4174 domain-containing protein [Pseudomonas sp. 21LCFQ02]|uniref:DUF4174 domain-containing protein n=1 Tax=unclassified Pseudomonas TaxID=196821 RepID=UPI0004F6EB20|nr:MULTISPECIES: DUF4174 domain-containing protein [unclassified Pseudomonas]MCO8161967.1 DUF4174 domain-containing protein [Pseudomonas sp. 21LCFQ010]MCO8168799.1 DUF4174 domain-containing protein [Pseudomonas sp. 21LCFQ02]MCQ9427003.1 DUF4174 domain-containing protein [Pseudomonas sp. LJDD11]BAP44966.1 hypothetical protein PSCI_4264 [Pseudomonas sp. StFLB209]